MTHRFSDLCILVEENEDVYQNTGDWSDYLGHMVEATLVDWKKGASVGATLARIQKDP
jgi:hypothetical protein